MNTLSELKYIYHHSFDNQDAYIDIEANMPDYSKYQKLIDNKMSNDNTWPQYRMSTLPVLTKEQEQHLFRQMNFYKYKSCKFNCSNSYDKAISIQQFLFLANYRLLVSFVRKKETPVSEIPDAISDCSIALLSAITNFDFSLGFKFSTYATWAFIRYRRRSTKVVSYTNFPDCFFEKTYTNDNNSRDVVYELMESLDNREKKIICLYSGLGSKSPTGKDTWTLTQIGDSMGLSKGRVQQIKCDAYKKMRQKALQNN